jgi:hypothetical protein
MTKAQKKLILLRAKKVFFAAMMDGYAGNRYKKSVKVKTDDGYTTITFVSGDYKVVDRYCTNEHSNKSAGTTTIHFKNSPIWWMWYSGFYKERAIPFLLATLKQSYKKRIWNGGRGPRSWYDSNLMYMTDGELKDFSDFEGREEISVRETDEIIGVHNFGGMSLI